MKMFRITLRELLLIIVIVGLSVGWARDRYRMAVLVDIANSYDILRALGQGLDGNSWSITWKDDSIRYQRVGGGTFGGGGPFRALPPFLVTDLPIEFTSAELAIEPKLILPSRDALK